tara:strand:- start:2733 stop:3332 length:600 start_codon:yes stop_codon:yes gene_type:complete
MKFYFDGCSFTFGQGVPADKRWSNLVCKHFGAEEFNIASSGATNDTIMRHFFTGQTINEYVPNRTFNLQNFDFFFIQFTFHLRKEYYDSSASRWRRYRYNDNGAGWAKRHIQFFQHYSTEIHTKYQEKVFEEINHTAITSHLKCLNKPYFLGHLGQSFGMTYDYDFRTPVDLLPCHHPSIEGNKVIAKKVIDIVEQKLL